MTTLMFGGGGHALEVTAVAWRAGVLHRDDPDVRYVVATSAGGSRAGLPYPAVTDDDVRGLVRDGPVRAILAIGDGRVRARLRDFLAGIARVSYPNVVDPSARLLGEVRPDTGLVLFPGAYVSMRVDLGEHVHVNVNASVSHECVVGDFTTISPQAAVCGRAVVGAGVFLGAGSIVVDDAHVPTDSVVGAGSVVLPGLMEPGTYSGAPARRHP